MHQGMHQNASEGVLERMLGKIDRKRSSAKPHQRSQHSAMPPLHSTLRVPTQHPVSAADLLQQDNSVAGSQVDTQWQPDRKIHNLYGYLRGPEVRC